jgi:hypothetical protein
MWQECFVGLVLIAPYNLNLKKTDHFCNFLTQLSNKEVCTCAGLGF